MLIDSKRHFLVINKPRLYYNREFENELIDCLNSRLHGVKYIGIVHDKDITDDNKIKTSHIHLYLEFPKKVTTNKIIREFTEFYSIDCSNIISDMSVYSVNACVRYLLHLDDLDKFQYDEHDLFYSDASMLELLNKDLDTLDIETLFDIVNDSKNLLEVYYRVGLNLSSRYRHVINDIWNNRQLLKNEK